MGIIGSRVHGIMDYLVGALLIAAPWLFDFARGGAETWIPVVLGASAILYSLITDYEMSIARIIPYKVHLALDTMSGLLLALSPWLFDFHEYVWAPHLIIGLLEVGTVLLSRKAPDTVSERTPGQPGGRVAEV